jgi:hypothetical protein
MWCDGLVDIGVSFEDQGHLGTTCSAPHGCLTPIVIIAESSD